MSWNIADAPENRSGHAEVVALRSELDRTITRHGRALLDSGCRATPALLDDLVRIAVEHAAATLSKAARQAQRPPVVAASTGEAAEQNVPSSHRTRTRTRRNEQA